MKKMGWNALLALSLAVCVLFSGCSKSAGADAPGTESKLPQAQDNAVQTNAGTGDYLAVCAYKLGFVAVGTDGIIEYIERGSQPVALIGNTKESLRDIVCDGESLIAVGENGTLLVSEDGQTFDPVKVKTESNLNAAVLFQGKTIVVGDGGTMLVSDDQKKWTATEPLVTGNITGIAANESLCIAVTDKGEALISENAQQWTMMNYNEYYEKTTRFQQIAASSGLFFVTGQEENGEPVILTTSMGGVWTENDPYMIEGNPIAPEKPLVFNDMAWDGQQLFIACDDGMLMTRPDCSQCNKLEEIGTSNLYAIACNETQIIVAGADRFVQFIDVEAARQYKISSETAHEKQQNGAVIIDVRGMEDYDAKHVAGSIHIDVSEVEQKLMEQVPDVQTEVIFYCAKGVRSQKALDIALGMGYQKVNNLGAIDNWTFDFEER